MLFNRTARLHTRLHGSTGSRLNCYQLQWIHCQRWMVSELAWHLPSGLLCLGTMLERYKSFQPKPENTDELKKVLQLIWDQLPQDSINKVILCFPKRLRACVKAGGGHFEHTLKGTTCQILVFVITVNVSWQWKLQVSVDYSVQNWRYGIGYLYSHNFGEI